MEGEKSFLFRVYFCLIVVAVSPFQFKTSFDDENTKLEQFENTNDR